jgi:hypothetical protein
MNRKCKRQKPSRCVNTAEMCTYVPTLFYAVSPGGFVTWNRDVFHGILTLSKSVRFK